ncbi:MAG: hypothetical protein A2078_10865 [Nitrospirae bacterium GWC2_57_9]|nr:MAG: hypothetical protein A2078_10865 [Nitrospirae bacterium GWC2_57_9]
MSKGENKKPEGSGELVPIEQVRHLSPAEYLRAAKGHLRNGKQKAAFSLLQQATVHYPEDAYILSYYGSLQAIVDKRYRSGVETCKRALSLLKKEALSGEDVLYPVLFLNLGKALVAAGKKKDAIDSFQKGLKYDSRNSEIRKELRELGPRKKPLLSFLGRSNPINKYIGMVLHFSKKESPSKKR